MTNETFEGMYCYFIRDIYFNVIGTCNADDHFQALDKFMRGLGTSQLESGKRYTIERDAGKDGKKFCMTFVR